MKTIKISDEMYNKLMDISKELNTQDHRATAMPYFFQVRTVQEVSCEPGTSDGEYIVDDGEEIGKNSRDLIEYLKDTYLDIYEENKTAIDEIIESNSKFENSGGDMYNINEIVELLSDDLGELEVCCYQEIETYSNAFLTEKACKEHIEQNDHHYNKPVDYLSCANRNPELELVMKFLAELSGGEIHK